MSFEGYDGLTEYQVELQLFDEAEEHIQNMKEASFQASKNEAEYKKAVAVEALKMQAQGVPATLVKDRVRGIPYVAELEQAAKNSDAVRSAEYELCMLKKKRAHVIHDERMREYGSPQGMGGF